MTKSIKETASKLNLAQLYICASESALLNDFDPNVPNQPLNGQFKINALRTDKKVILDESSSEREVLRFYIECAMRYIVGDLTEVDTKSEEVLASKIGATIKATYCVEYVVNQGVELSDDEIKRFGDVNVTYHVWPFWREFSQNTCLRMNLPASTLPMLIVNSESNDK